MHRLVEAHRTADFESISLRSVFHASQRHLEPPIISLPSEGRCAGSGACQRESSLGLRKFLHRWFLRLAAIQAWTQCSSRTLGRTPAQASDPIRPRYACTWFAPHLWSRPIVLQNDLLDDGMYGRLWSVCDTNSKGSVRT